MLMMIAQWASALQGLCSSKAFSPVIMLAINTRRLNRRRFKHKLRPAKKSEIGWLQLRVEVFQVCESFAVDSSMISKFWCAHVILISEESHKVLLEALARVGFTGRPVKRMQLAFRVLALGDLKIMDS